MRRQPTGPDRATFESFWHAHIHRVLAYAERHVGRDAAYDIAASTFLTAWRSWHSLPEVPLPWLLSVARGQVRNHLRAQRRRWSLEERLRALDRAAHDGPEVEATATERAAALALLAALPDPEREALLLVAWDGLTAEQAASVLGVRPGTLRVRLHRARRRLEVALATDADHTMTRSPR